MSAEAESDKSQEGLTHNLGENAELAQQLQAMVAERPDAEEPVAAGPQEEDKGADSRQEAAVADAREAVEAATQPQAGGEKIQEPMVSKFDGEPMDRLKRNNPEDVRAHLNWYKDQIASDGVSAEKTKALLDDAVEQGLVRYVEDRNNPGHRHLRPMRLDDPALEKDIKDFFIPGKDKSETAPAIYESKRKAESGRRPNEKRVAKTEAAPKASQTGETDTPQLGDHEKVREAFNWFKQEVREGRNPLGIKNAALMKDTVEQDAASYDDKGQLRLVKGEVASGDEKAAAALNAELETFFTGAAKTDTGEFAPTLLGEYERIQAEKSRGGEAKLEPTAGAEVVLADQPRPQDTVKEPEQAAKPDAEADEARKKFEQARQAEIDAQKAKAEAEKAEAEKARAEAEAAAAAEKAAEKQARAEKRAAAKEQKQNAEAAAQQERDLGTDMNAAHDEALQSDREARGASELFVKKTTEMNQRLAPLEQQIAQETDIPTRMGLIEQRDKIKAALEKETTAAVNAKNAEERETTKKIVDLRVKAAGLIGSMDARAKAGEASRHTVRDGALMAEIRRDLELPPVPVQENKVGGIGNGVKIAESWTPVPGNDRMWVEERINRRTGEVISQTMYSSEDGPDLDDEGNPLPPKSVLESAKYLRAEDTDFLADRPGNNRNGVEKWTEQVRGGTGMGEQVDSVYMDYAEDYAQRHPEVGPRYAQRTVERKNAQSPIKRGGGFLRWLNNRFSSRQTR